jgi:DNA-binding MarR family transcriptional regulator
MANWGLFTTHSLVWASIAKNPAGTARQIGADFGLTERTTHKIILDLDEAAYISRSKVGRNNTYSIHLNVNCQLAT